MSRTVYKFFEEAWDNYAWNKIRKNITVYFRAFLDFTLKDSDTMPVLVTRYLDLKSINEKERIVINLSPVETEIYSMPKSFFCLCRQSDFIKEVHIKNAIYYGNSNCIFDCDYNPLFISMLRYVIKEDKIIPTGLVCKISYRVFENPTGLIEKFIIKQGIPFYRHKRINSTVTFKGGYADVIIDDLDYLIIRPKLPAIEMAYSENVGNTLVDYYNNVQSFW